jgi:prepilin-type N-terminal cleavage/methylation domain-containing protein
MNDRRGYTFIEALVAMLIVSIVIASGVKMLAADIRLNSQQDELMATDQNLRVAMEALVDSLRSAGDGAPEENLSLWISWLDDDFSSNPRIIEGDSDTLLVARCTPVSIAELDARADAGVTRLEVHGTQSDAALSATLDDGARRLILIDDREHAFVTGVSTEQIAIDTDPTQTGNQGLDRSYPAGTPLCRVDVSEFGVQVDETTGETSLYRDDHQGDGPLAVAMGITDMQIVTVAAGRAYEIQLTGRSANLDLLRGTSIVRELTSEVNVRNAPAT